MKSRIGCPNMHIDGENLVSLSGVFLYCRIARWNWAVLSSPLGLVLPVIRRLTVFTPISAYSCCEGRPLMIGDAARPLT